MAMMTGPAMAADFYWSGQSPSSDNIDQNDNWWNGSHPASGDNLYFNNVAGSRHAPYNNVGSWFTCVITDLGAGGIKWRGDATYALKFENHSDTSLFEIEADIGNLSNPDQDLSLNPMGAGGMKVDNSVTITGGKQIKVYGAQTLTLAGPVSGSFATLAILEGATVVLSSAATYTGDTYVNNGTLRLSVNNALANSGNYLWLGDSSGSASASIYLDGGMTLFTLINVRSGNSGLITLANTSSTTGAATFAGNLSLDHDLTLYANSPRSNVICGASLDLKNQTLVADGGGTNYVTGVLWQSSGNGKLTKNGAGGLILAGSANNTYSGVTTVNSGALSLGMRSDGLSAFGGDLTINGGAVSYSSSMNNQIPDTANVAINVNGTLAFGARNETIGQTSPCAAGSFSLNGGYVTMGSATVRLARNPSVKGGTIILTGGSSVLEVDQELIFNGGTIDFSPLSAGPRLSLHGGDGTGITYQPSGTSTARISNSGGHGLLALNESATTVFTVAEIIGLDTELQIEVPMVNMGTSGIRKEGAGRLLLRGANTYTGATTISAGSLALGTNATSVGSISVLSSISIAAGATFDVSGLGASATYTLGSSASLTASGTGTTVGTTAAAINGGFSGTVSLGSRPVTLNYDGSHPALYISQGILLLNGNAFIINNTSGTALGCGTYTIIQQASGTIANAGNCSVSVTGSSQVANSTASIAITGGTVLLNITGCASPAQLDMSGSGSFCSSAGSQVFGVSGATEVDVTYSLQRNGTTVDSKAGAGSAIAFAAQATPGTYTVVGVRGEYATTMNGSATINASPVAPVPNVSSNLAPGVSMKIKVSELLAAWTGSSLSVQSAGPNSTAGATVAEDSTYIYYLPPSSPITSDHIPYIVSDANGCTTTANLDLVIVAPGGIAQTITVSRGKATICFYGIPGRRYNVQRATSLGPSPPVDWSTVTTGSPLTASPRDGAFSYTDTSPPTGIAYYRSLQH